MINIPLYWVGLQKLQLFTGCYPDKQSWRVQTSLLCDLDLEDSNQTMYMTLCFIFLAAGLFCPKLSMVVCHYRQGDYVTSQGCYQLGQGHRVRDPQKTICPSHYLLNSWTFCDQIWYVNTSWVDGSVIWNLWVCIFQGQGDVMWVWNLMILCRRTLCPGALWADRQCRWSGGVLIP